MTESDIISKIIKLEYEITCRVISDRSFRPTENDEYKNHRKELQRLRKKLIKIKNESSQSK